MLGAGREKVDSVIDPGVGLTVRAVPGDVVAAGQPILTIAYHDRGRADQARALADTAILIADAPVAARPIIRAHITGASA